MRRSSYAAQNVISMEGRNSSCDSTDLYGQVISMERRNSSCGNTSEPDRFKMLSDDEIRLAADIGFDEDELSQDENDIFEQEEDDDVMMPPPKSMFDRRKLAPGGLKASLHMSLYRARSASPRKPNDFEQQSKRGMQRIVSLPNLQYDRSIYNRSVGKTVLASVTERNEQQGMGEAQRRASEFDLLLGDL